MSLERPLVLGSASPRRHDLLTAIGVPHEVVPADVEEPPAGSAPPRRLVEQAARLKAEAVAHRHPERLVLGADTIVVLGDPEADGQVLLKPADAAEARRMLERLSGREHLVISSVALVAGGRAAQGDSLTRVRFAELEEDFLRRYVATGEPLDKAGAYGAQGRMGTRVRGIEGSWTNVVGLPLELLPELFAELGERLEDWQAW